MTYKPPNPFEGMEGTIKSFVEQCIRTIAKEEADKASKRVSERMQEEVAKIALKVCQMADYEVRADRLIITIKKEGL